MASSWRAPPKELPEVVILCAGTGITPIQAVIEMELLQVSVCNGCCCYFASSRSLTVHVAAVWVLLLA